MHLVSAQGAGKGGEPKGRVPADGATDLVIVDKDDNHRVPPDLLYRVEISEGVHMVEAAE